MGQWYCNICALRVRLQKSPSIRWRGHNGTSACLVSFNRVYYKILTYLDSDALELKAIAGKFERPIIIIIIILLSFLGMIHRHGPRCR